MASDIVDKIFTSSDLAALYYSNKLKYDPKNYSFRDRLIAFGNKPHTFIAETDYSTEHTLEALIESTGKKFEMLAWDSTEDIGFEIELPINYPRLISGTPCFVKHDNMYFTPEVYLRYDDLEYNKFVRRDSHVVNTANLTKLKTSEELEAMLQLHIALCREGSLVKYLGWQCTDWKHLKLTDVINATAIVDALEHCDNVPKLQIPEHEAILFSAVNTPYEKGDMWSDILSVTDAGVEQLVINTRFKCILFGLEILHALYTIPNPKYVNIIEQKLAKSVSWVSDMLYEASSSGTGITLSNSEVDRIVHTFDPIERYSLIYEYMNKHCIRSTVSTLFKNSVTPEWLLELSAFCNEHAMWHMRVQYVSILYKYCADHKLLDELNKSDPSAYVSLLGDLSTSTLGTEEMMETVEKSSIMDLPTPTIKYTDDMDSVAGAHVESSPTYEALDKLSASYSDDRYSFDVEDVVDTNPNPAYTKIASHCELLNKNLIRRIKDIKVYNTGGKNSGKSKGRLDRKAIHKYKTCKDIFYDNTYKIKESDLAFGIILDVSGSMSGKGIENGTATMIVLHETLKALGINHSIITHTSDGKYHSEIRRYQAFKEDKTYSTLKNYALGTIRAYWGNCDSGALFYMEKALSRVKNKDKICLIFSDGEPTECTGTDLKDQVRKMERRGIKVIGIGINYSNIKNYYSEYANGSTLAEMFDIVSEILRRYVLEKED